MNPSATLGTFLRYWRSECAGLTRAQLAIAVAAHCKGGRKRVTEAVIRAWESGQPPADTEELDGLLAVMRRHGLTEPEISSVRRAVFAACLDRHYPELFVAEEFALHPDVDGQAAQMVLQWPPPPAGSDPVEFIAQFASLERAVGRDFEPAQLGSQRRRQQVALAYLRQIMSAYCQSVALYGVALQHAIRNERFVRDCFPNGGPSAPVAPDCFPYGGSSWPMTPEGLRREVLRLTALTTESTEPVAEMLKLSRAQEESGNPERAAWLFIGGIALIPAPGVGTIRDALWHDLDRHLEVYGNEPEGLKTVLAAAAADGKRALAESGLQAIEPLRHGSAHSQNQWHGLMGEFALCAGNPNEAEAHLQAHLRLSRELGAVYALTVMPHLLRACEEARKHPRADRVELWAEAERVGKAELRPRRVWTGRGRHRA